jgi:lipopolysaccharide biosynthesis glycosyltransferase
MKKSLLVTLADRQYFQAAKQLIASAYFNARWDGDYMILSYDLSKKQSQWFKDRNIIVKSCPPVFSHSRLRKLYTESPRHRPFKHLSVAINKLHLFKPEFKNWENIIYIDTDVIIQKPLNLISNVRGFWATQDTWPLHRHFTDDNPKVFQELSQKYDLNGQAFSSGLMAFNTDIIKEATFQEIKKMYVKYNSLRKFSDQSVLNLFFYKKWKKLAGPYNSPEPLISPNFKNQVIVIHFMSKDKPWYPNSPFYLDWKYNLKKSSNMNVFHFIKEIRTTHIHVLWYSALLALSSGRVNFIGFIGKIGNHLKTKHPVLYSFIKNIIYGEKPE